MFDDALLTSGRAEYAARVLRALGNPQRLLILCRLYKVGECSAGELAQRLGLSASALSPHLARMREESLVQQRRDGRTLYYRLNTQLDLRLPTLLESLCDETAAGSAATRRMDDAAAVIDLALSSAGPAADDSIWQTPAVVGAGRVRPLPQAAYQPDPAATCQAVFTLTRGSDAPNRANPALQRVARAVNLHAQAGVPTAQMAFVVVVSGAAIDMALDDAHYRAQHGVGNPNLPLLRQLRECGMKLTVCGQTMAEHGYRPEWMNDSVSLALSALTAIIALQQQGCALVPL